MVVKKNILATIKKINSLYNLAPTAEAIYYSKLAIIELCGWIEEAMDSIAESFVNREISSRQYLDIFNNIKNNNYGFQYNSNFRKMMIQVIGLSNMEKIEERMERTGQITLLSTELNNLKSIRNSAAHTHIGATTTFQAPSVTKAQLERIFPILRGFQREISSL